MRYRERCRKRDMYRVIEERRTNRSRSAPAAMTAVFRASTRVWNGGTWKRMIKGEIMG